MRRFVTLAVLLLFTVPFGVSISGCSKAAVATFCNGQNSGVVVGQTTTLDLEPRLTGISLNQGQIGSVSGPSAKDCKGTSTNVTNVVYGSTDITLVDVVPQTGRLCAGTWNRQTGGGIPDYTVCTPTTRSGTAFITASSEGVTSNPLPVYVHPVVTSILLGPPSTNCKTDPASNCYDTSQVNGTCLSTPISVKAYDGNSCLSQGSSAQLVARAFKGTDVTAASNNISCLVLHLPPTVHRADPSRLDDAPNWTDLCESEHLADFGCDREGYQGCAHHQRAVGIRLHDPDDDSRKWQRNHSYFSGSSGYHGNLPAAGLQRLPFQPHRPLR
jgi:hypothetical protein